MRKNWPYILITTLVILVLYKVSAREQPHDPNWNESYTLSSKEPYGCYVFKAYMDDMMDGATEITRGTCYQTLEDSMYMDHNYVFVNNEFQPSALDVKRLLEFASHGNNVLISARNFGLLADTLHVDVGDPLYFQTQNDSLKTVGAVIKSGSTSIQANLVNPNLHLKKNAVFDKSYYETVFGHYDTAKVIILGRNAKGYTNFLRIKVGDGSFYLHTLPDAFGNYYAAKENTSDYLINLLSYLPKQTTLIDLHYKVGRVENEDTRRYVFSEPSLRLGYMVLIIAALIGLFLGGKRRQRPVPVVTPPSNSTLEFVEQVGALYYNKGDHTDIAWKKIAYFLESIRSRFYIQTMEFDEKFMRKIEDLSGMPKDEVAHLFSVIGYIRGTTVVSEKELRRLEELIRNFNTKSKR